MDTQAPLSFPAAGHLCHAERLAIPLTDRKITILTTSLLLCLLFLATPTPTLALPTEPQPRDLNNLLVPRQGTTAPVDPSLPPKEIGSGSSHPGDVRWCCSLGHSDGRQNIWCNYDQYSNPGDQGGTGGAGGSGGGQSNAVGPEPAPQQSEPYWAQPLQYCNSSRRYKMLVKEGKRDDKLLGDGEVVAVTNGAEVVDMRTCKAEEGCDWDHVHVSNGGPGEWIWGTGRDAAGHTTNPTRPNRMGYPAPIGAGFTEKRADYRWKGEKTPFHPSHQHGCLDEDGRSFHDAKDDCYKQEGENWAGRLVLLGIIVTHQRWRSGMRRQSSLDAIPFPLRLK